MIASVPDLCIRFTLIASFPDLCILFTFTRVQIFHDVIKKAKATVYVCLKCNQDMQCLFSI